MHANFKPAFLHADHRFSFRAQATRISACLHVCDARGKQNKFRRRTPHDRHSIPHEKRDLMHEERRLQFEQINFFQQGIPHDSIEYSRVEHLRNDR